MLDYIKIEMRYLTFFALHVKNTAILLVEQHRVNVGPTPIFADKKSFISLVEHHADVGQTFIFYTEKNACIIMCFFKCSTCND